MEEDIKFLEKRIDLNRKMYLEFGRLLSLDDETVNAIENLINKNKELEKMVELMASYIWKHDLCEKEIKKGKCKFIFESECKEEIKEYFKKKASEEWINI